ncbi:MAG: hypothetical protein IT280_02245 [Ignavibacteria bacterium]|nr:hypothetical protein [Ignavibacteria bacterium]
MNDEQKENIEISNRFLGYGDPNKAVIYYFCLEEAAPFKSSKEILNIVNSVNQFIEINNNRYFFDNTRKNRGVKGNTESFQAYLSYKILKDFFDIKELPETVDLYKSGYYIENEDRVFSSNTYPLGASNIGSNTNISLTGFSNINDYYDYAWEQTKAPRKEILKNFINDIKNKRNNSDYFIFIMGNFTYPPNTGRSAQERLKQICEELGYKFGKFTFPDSKDKLNNSYTGTELKWECSDCKRIWLIGHPSKGASDKRVADRIVDFLINNFRRSK